MERTFSNFSARYCYEAVGFRSVGKNEIYKMAVGEWECIEMELPLVWQIPVCWAECPQEYHIRKVRWFINTVFITTER